MINYSQALQELNLKIDIKSISTKKIQFTGVGTKDVYNITAPFESAGYTVIAGRVEKRDEEYSEIFFFEEINKVWTPIKNSSSLKLQDPFFTIINNQLILGGVEVKPVPGGPEGALTWRTIFYRGKDIFTLEKLFQGPEHMKDIRLVELADKSIGVFTRPQGEKGGRGKIAYTSVKSLDELSEEVIEAAELLDQFPSDEWGGANEIHLLKNGKLGVLAHVAKFSEGNTRHYSSSAFLFDPETKEYSKMKIIANRALFTPGVAKRPDLEDVVFSGGLKRHGDGKATLYAGIGDAEAHWLNINDPFVEWEK